MSGIKMTELEKLKQDVAERNGKIQLLSQHIKELKTQIEQLTFLHNEDVNTIKLLNEQIREMKQERSAEVRQRAINEIVSAIEKDREEGR